ncbi:MAG TPA: PA2779 family protein, partial [Nitrospirota bacterium]|nr:PA2779 family protein [Nitrospirota bacterium]
GALIAISSLTGRAEAMFVPATPQRDTVSPAQTPGNRAVDMARIQVVLESKVVRQKLMDLGLSSEEAMARINKLSDEQVHQFASRLDSLQAGGVGGSGLIIVLLLVIIILLLI